MFHEIHLSIRRDGGSTRWIVRSARDGKVWRRRRINFSIEQETARSTLNRRSLFVSSSAVFVIPSVDGYNVSLVRKSETLGYCYLIAS